MPCSPSRANTLGSDCSWHKCRGVREVDALLLRPQSDQSAVEEMHPSGKLHSC